MKKIGLTGGIGSGKTFVAQMFEKLSVPVYYSDREAKRLMNINSTIRKKLINIVGDEVYLSENELNKTFLAQKIFSDKELIEQVNEIVHPIVREDFNEWAENQISDYVLQESAILFEIGANKLMDGMILVWAPNELRIKRVMQRDGAKLTDVLKRMESQWPQESKLNLTNFVIKNDEVGMLLPQIVEIHQKLRKTNK